MQTITKNNLILESLNHNQREAVETLEGPVLVLAGAGSGKTKTLTHRIGNLVANGVNPGNILAVTFTNKAAGEMRERLTKLLVDLRNSQEQPGFLPNVPWLGTFHSICVRILRRDISALGYENNFVIYDSSDSMVLVKQAMKDLRIDPKQLNANAVRSAISGAKSELLNPAGYEAVAEGYFMEQVAKVYRNYQAELKKANALDFDDLLALTVKLFQNHAEILNDYQQMFKYILIDEYQDTNLAQYSLIKMLGTHGNVCAVGDDYQAIYGWRGANFRNILNFAKDWPQAKTIKLEQNYRSTQTILDAADSVIKNNYNRTDKSLWTDKGQGAPINVYEAFDALDEADFIVTEIKSLQKEFASLNNFAILYRTNAQSRVLEEAFLKREMPYRLVGAIEFYSRKEIKDVMSYLRVIENPNDLVSLERASKTPSRGIGPKTFELVRLEGAQLAQEKNAKLRSFFELFQTMRQYANEHTVSELVDFVVGSSGMRLALLQEGEEGEERLANVEELKSVAEGYTSLREFLEATALISDIDNYNNQSEAVTMMTLHNSKGLEFPVVFIVGLEETIFPHSRALSDPAEMEEERRLCYVGITRAKERLYLMRANSRLIYGSFNSNPASRFISEIPSHLLDVI